MNRCLITEKIVPASQKQPVRFRPSYRAGTMPVRSGTNRRYLYENIKECLRYGLGTDGYLKPYRTGYLPYREVRFVFEFARHG